MFLSAGRRWCAFVQTALLAACCICIVLVLETSAEEDRFSTFRESHELHALRTFHFIWTSNPVADGDRNLERPVFVTGTSAFSLRNQRSIESVFYHYPQATVYLHTNYDFEHVRSKFFMAGSYDLRIQKYDPCTVAKSTPLQVCIGVAEMRVFVRWS